MVVIAEVIMLMVIVTTSIEVAMLVVICHVVLVRRAPGMGVSCAAAVAMPPATVTAAVTVATTVTTAARDGRGGAEARQDQRDGCGGNAKQRTSVDDWYSVS